MGEVVRVLLLKDSSFSLNPPDGKVVYITSESKKIVEENLLRSELIDRRIPYPLLNPLQTVFHKLYRGGNALIMSPTSSGKTLIAYLFMRNFKGRLVYTAPTRALVKEKATELRHYYPKDVELRTGESIFENFKGPRAKVIVSTYEHLAHAFRNASCWTQELDAVVVDEVHQVSKRWVLEEIITACLRWDIPMLCLSATLPGFEELAQWIEANFILQSEWRPVPLHREVRKLVEFHPLKISEESSQEDIIASRLLNALFSLRKREEKVILFVPKKSMGWKILEIANEEKIGIMNQTLPFDTEEQREPEIAFHNADVPKEEREEIEKAFRDGNLNLLIATQTLAYGVNLPADRVIVMVRFFARGGKLKSIPDSLDILQMEGRAGRLGIKDVGYSNLLVYGAKEKSLHRELEEALERPFKTASMEEDESQDSLSFFLLLAHMYEEENYWNYLRRTYSFRKVSKKTVEEVLDFLLRYHYVQKGKLTEKGIFCIKTGMPPTRFEEFFHRKVLGLELMITVRPLLYMKKFDGLFEFLRRKDRFEEDLELIRAMLLPCGKACLKDNTDQFIFYVEGLTVRYSNLKNPPGEFSYLGTDVLHLIRTLKEIDLRGFYSFPPLEVLKIAHSVKYGIKPEYASLSGIKGIGHIRANLLKEALEESGRKAPPILSPVEPLLENLKDIKELLLDKLVHYRNMSGERAKEELTKVVRIIHNNRKGYMVDDRILLALGLFSIGPQALGMNRRELVDYFLNQGSL